VFLSVNWRQGFERARKKEAADDSSFQRVSVRRKRCVREMCMSSSQQAFFSRFNMRLKNRWAEDFNSVKYV